MDPEKKPAAESGEGPEIKVTDRRRVDEHGEARAADPAPAAPADESPPAHAPALDKIDFPTFIYSLFTQGLASLGELRVPGQTDPGTPDFASARNIIDILQMLEEKTRGNLSTEEANLLRGLLHELRLRFVQRISRPPEAKRESVTG